MLAGYRVLGEVFQSRKRVVYRAIREKDGRPVIIKTHKKDLPDVVDLTNLRREYEIIQNLKGEGIPQVFGLESFKNSLALILEDIGGQSLRSLIDSNRFVLSPLLLGDENHSWMDLRIFLRIAISLADTIAALHHQDVVHKDINPRNIVIDPDSLRAQLIDFGIATRLPSETQKILRPELLEGTLAYISPEQTGRMNRTIDYRTDFYSLGVTLYEMLTGKLPFETTDPMELVHHHIAVTPIAPLERNPAVPEVISNIVMKLLSKTAEDRYSSAVGLKTDLERCLRSLEAANRIETFVPGEEEVSDRFTVPQKLYGREDEIAALMASYDRVCQGSVETVLVYGYSGIGKTSLIQEVHKPMVRRRGYFIAGKFDQLNRIIPYSALIQAFREMVQQIVTESDDRVQKWKDRLLAALGINGRIIVDVIPEVEWIIGPQPEVPTLGPAESENRFFMVFQKFIGCLAGGDHPLVLFLDDLQWADQATLKMLLGLSTNLEIGHLMIIGAYRDNEVSGSHPLEQTISEMKEAKARIIEIALGPLGDKHLRELVADALKSSGEESLPLSQLVMRKTAGNPFFVTQFLKSMQEDSLIRFDYELGRWIYDLKAIEGRQMTDNVVELMASRILKLPDHSRHVMQLASCIGNSFDLHTLAIVNEKSPNRTVMELWEAVHQGLVLALDHAEIPTVDQEMEMQPRITYKFLHDRVQQASYELIPTDQRSQLHARIGKLILAGCNEVEREERLFDIVNHLNLGVKYLKDPVDLLRLCELNLDAGRKAKSSAAFGTALGYLHAGRDLLPDPAWEKDYEFAFALHYELAECEYLCGNFSAAEEYCQLLLARSRSDLQKGMIHNIRILQYENMAEYSRAVEAGREGLIPFGISFPDDEKEKSKAFQSEMARIQDLLGKREIRELKNLPVAHDPGVKMSMKLLMTAWAPAYIAGDIPLFILIAATMVRLSLEHGNTEESAYGYVIHGVTLGSLGDYRSGYEFGRLALEVNDLLHDRKLRSKVHHMFSCFINLWRQPLQTCFKYSREAYRSGLETGDFAYATYGCFHESWYGLLAGNDLKRFQEQYRSNAIFLKQIKNYSFLDAQFVILHWGLCLEGKTEGVDSLSAYEFQEDEYVQKYSGNAFFETFYYVAKLHLLFVSGKTAEAEIVARKAEEVVPALGGTIWPALLAFAYGLTLAANDSGKDELEREAGRQKLEELHARLKIWAENCPKNFEQMSCLVHAEMSRIRGEMLPAVDSYERAIRLARENEWIYVEAIASELFGKFWLERNHSRVAQVFLSAAHSAFLQWGAVGKAKQMEDQYFSALSQQVGMPAVVATGTGTLYTTQTKATALDVFTVMKAAQTISREMDLERLVDNLIRIAMENAGARRGLLLKDLDGRQFVEAEGLIAGQNIEVIHQPDSKDIVYAPSVVNYAKRTMESMVISDATRDSRLSSDSYATTGLAKSIMCVPVVHQNQLIGILYLENDLATDTFTPERVQIVQILASQAAIALENARLYQEMKAEAEQRKQIEETLRSITEGTAAVTGDDFFRSLARHLAQVFDAKYAFVTECIGPENTEVRTLAFWARRKFVDNISFPVAGTPCERVVEGQLCYYPDRLQSLFPEDIGLQELHAESYLGVPLPDSSGKILGHIAVMDDRPMNASPGNFPLLRIFAARAGAELERMFAEEGLRKSEERFRTLFASNPIGVAINDAKGKFLEVNQTFIHMLGYSREQFEEMTFREITLPEDLKESHQLFSELVSGKRSYFSVEKRYRTAAGEVVWANTHCSSMRDSEGRFIYTFAMIVDITERKAAEQALRKALEEVEQLKNRLQAENIYLQEEIKTEHDFEEIIGASVSIRKVFQKIERVAPTDSSVLITGETGTGKELVARAIHNLSRRRDSPLIKVNCAALPSGLIESELFGHEKGAFTGATARKKGRFELADGGTILLDEIGELPLETQAKLLRVLQEHEFERVGGDQTLRVDVRVIAATNRDLQDAVKRRTFRSDLLYRLNIFPLHLPPLRERMDDIPLLASYFVGRFARRMGKKVNQLSPETMNYLNSYDWPGNIRELANILERAIILCDDSVLRLEHIGAFSPSERSRVEIATLEDSDRNHILRALEKTNWVVGGPSGAAKMLGLNRTTLLARMKKLGIQRP